MNEDFTEEREEDREENSIVKEFLEKGCSCQRGQDKHSCSETFPEEFCRESRDRCHALSSEQLDMVILGHLSAHRRYPIFMKRYQEMRPHRKDTQETQDMVTKFRHSTKYFVGDVPICEVTFCFLDALSKKRLQTLQKHLDENGLCPRTHGSKGKPTSNSMGPDTVKDVVTFIRSVAEVKGLQLPGRLASVRDLSGTYLPSDLSKVSLHHQYEEAAKTSGRTPVGLTLFKNIWMQYVLEITVMKPQSDVCETCQKNNGAILKSAGMQDIVKEERYKAALDHLNIADMQRKNYNDQCQMAKEEMILCPTEPGQRTLSFDYAQNIVYPHSPCQVGPAYFKSARKCGLFGILCEGTNVQTNFLIDEADSVGKGANTVISMLDWYLNRNQCRHLKLHADNCTGQNKNNALIQYLQWRCIQKLNDDIEISFMLPGHTKFGPDRMFGLIKRKYQITQVDTLDDIVTVVNTSTHKKQNQAVITYDYVREEREVVWRDWVAFLKPLFKPIPSILQFQHFSCSREVPEEVALRANAQSEAQTIITKRDKNAHRIRGSLPDVLEPKGFDVSRQWYLHEQVADLCSSTLAASITCPKPRTAKPGRKRTEE